MYVMAHLHGEPRDLPQKGPRGARAEHVAVVPLRGPRDAQVVLRRADAARGDARCHPEEIRQDEGGGGACVAPMPSETKPIEKNMSALNSRMKLTSWYSSVRWMHAKTKIQ